MDYFELIKNWHQRASSDTTDEYFSKYVFEYLAFIAFLRTQLYPDTKRDVKAIQNLQIDERLRGKYLGLIESSSELKDNWKVVIDKLIKNRLGNTSINVETVNEIEHWKCKSFNYNGQLINKEDFDLRGVICGYDDWDNMINFWNAIRNNLFHGTKNPENPRDKFAVEYGYKTIKELVGILINDT